MALAITVLLAANAAWRWWHNRPPFGPAALSMQSSLQLVGFTKEQSSRLVDEKSLIRLRQ
jgi:hypothetical protein